MNVDVAVYLDSSAIVKLVVREPESAALRRWLGGREPLVASALARTEVLRALLPAGEAFVARGRLVLQRLDIIRISDRILNAAGVREPHELRSLDAIHLATALDLGRDLSAMATYDDRLAAAAAGAGIRVVAPK
jgi:uncharacterized protein